MIKVFVVEGGILLNVRDVVEKINSYLEEKGINPEDVINIQRVFSVVADHYEVWYRNIDKTV